MVWLSISMVLVVGVSNFAHLRVSPRLLVTGQGRHAFPGREKIEIAEFLRQFDLVVHDRFALFVVMDFDIAGQREILAQRMSLEPVIGEDPAMVRKTFEGDAEQIPDLPLPPCGARPKRGDGGNGRRPIWSGRRRGCARSGSRRAGCRPRRNARRARENRRRKYPSPGRRRSHRAGARAARKRLPARHGPRARPAHAGRQRRRAEQRRHRAPYPLLGHLQFLFPQPRKIVPVRRIFFCNCITPYTNASAVGGQPGT